MRVRKRLSESTVTMISSIKTFMMQAASTIMILGNFCITARSTVDSWYKVACFGNLVCCFFYHGLQIECPGVTSTFFGDFKASFMLQGGATFKLLRTFDRSFVCAVTIYHPDLLKFVPVWAIFVACCVAGAHDGSLKGAIFVGVLLDVWRVRILSPGLILTLLAAQVVGILMQIHPSVPHDRWVTPYRWIWHCCCATFLFVRKYTM